MNEAERIKRAHDAKAALDQFLEPAIAAIETDYAEKLIEAAASTNPRAVEIMTRLGIGVQVVRQVRSLIMAYVQDGQIARNEMIRAEKNEKMTAPARRLVNIGNG